MGTGTSLSGRSKWQRYGLRWLFITVAVCAILSFFIGKNYREQRAFRRALDRVEAVGARVMHYDTDARLGPWNMVLEGPVVVIHTQALSDKKLSELVDRLHDVVGLNPRLNVALNVNSRRISNDGLRSLRDLPRLKLLGLASTNVTDESVVHLATLKDLRGLDISRNDFSEEAVKTLREQLPNTILITEPLIKKVPLDN